MTQARTKPLDGKIAVNWRMSRMVLEALKSDALRKGINPRNVPFMLNQMLHQHYFGGKKLENQE